MFIYVVFVIKYGILSWVLLIYVFLKNILDDWSWVIIMKIYENELDYINVSFIFVSLFSL